MKTLQELGVPAGIVQNGEDLVDRDHQIRERHFFVPLEHPTMGVCNHRGWPAKLSKTPYELTRAPCLGEHTEFVLTNILSLSTEEFLDALESGALG